MAGRAGFPLPVALRKVPCPGAVAGAGRFSLRDRSGHDRIERSRADEKGDIGSFSYLLPETGWILLEMPSFAAAAFFRVDRISNHWQDDAADRCDCETWVFQQLAEGQSEIIHNAAPPSDRRAAPAAPATSSPAPPDPNAKRKHSQR